jgi:addiction module RelE/StbE family toxin
MQSKKYKIKFTSKASYDLDENLSYMKNELYSDSSAKKFLESVESKIMNLSEFPFSCNYVSDNFLKRKGYRKLIVDNYIIFYIVNENSKIVIIMRILYGSRKYQEFL